MLTEPGTLRIEDYERDGLHTWVLAGRLNRATAPAFNAAIALLCAQGVSGIALDLGRLRSVDSSGLRAISFARDLCEGHGFELSLTPLSRLHAPQRRLIAKRRASSRKRQLHGGDRGQLHDPTAVDGKITVTK